MPGAGTATTEGHKVSWHEASNACAEQGATLVSMRSSADLVCLEKVIEQSYDSFWIGLIEKYDPKTNKYSWTWMNEEVEAGSYSNWRRGNGHIQEHLSQEKIYFGAT
jgi:hypothetical protein